MNGKSGSGRRWERGAGSRSPIVRFVPPPSRASKGPPPAEGVARRSYHRPVVRWQVGLEGEPVDINGLAAAFSDRPLRVMEDDGTFWLEAEELEHLSDHAQVKSAAERLITRLNGAMRLGNPSYQNVKLGNLREQRADGTHAVSTFIEPGTISIRASVLPPKILGGVPTKQLGDPARSYMGAAAGDPDADEALDLWANEPHNWVNLSKVFEIIRARDGFDPSVSKSQLDRFRHTANHEGAAGRQARHARLGTDPPKHPMTALEAEALMRRLLQSWFDSLT
jgi:hypothetical protein